MNDTGIRLRRILKKNWLYRGFPNAIPSGQQYNFGEKPTVILYTDDINHHVGTPKTKTFGFFFKGAVADRPGSSEVPRNPLTRWDVSSIPANGIFLTKKLKNKNKNAQRVEND